MLGGGVVDAFGSGGEDARGREYEAVLEFGGDEEDAYVMRFLGWVWKGELFENVRYIG